MTAKRRCSCSCSPSPPAKSDRSRCATSILRVWRPAGIGRRCDLSCRRLWLGPLLWLLASLAAATAAADPLDQVRAMEGASLLLKERGQERIAHHPDTQRVPASTMKLLTALAALETWGRGYRLQTDFYLDDADWLWVKGYADPYLVSEELELIVSALEDAGVRRLAGMGLDDSFFSASLEIPGRSASANPYDAPVTALAANFNTLHLVRNGSRVRSAEPQTPLTPTARRFGLDGGSGRRRVNLRQRPIAVGYFGELLAAKLRAAGIPVGDRQLIAPVPRQARHAYRHLNSRTLVEMIEPMLEYSNNFIANAFFLRLAQPEGKGRVTTAAAKRAMTDFARRRFGWRQLSIHDGAGLSRANRLSARQLVDVLDAFAPYRDLMPEQEGNSRVRAKTGTLRGVSCYAGYVRRREDWAPFALLINQPVQPDLRRRLASSLVR